ncbi:hypothetical protein [Pseudobacteriovorax antillogorgiicola]|uniref:Porin n=1 Tax=Pseudobacteriovorax antillogorgiicola TaxID=1513793 RepID=A0A1Y6CA62_9BACT|nr:hypothetical protein [Pseudobacteriovorax antillogorgiicola]TCS49909.1 hypothetical protein EDD56_114154 [Pseudobacteriovorax antillogorgiicola]SMF44873.1 hypothetical protein SAMN06296036_113159 [Pseudobacteriovorax antillogorgiicola]
MKLLISIIALLPAICFGTNQVEVNVGQFKDKNQSVQMQQLGATYESNNFWGSGTALTVQYNFSGKQVDYLIQNELLADAIGVDQAITEESHSIYLAQGLGIGRQAGVVYGQRQSPLGDLSWVGVNTRLWFFSETLRTQWDYRQTRGEQPVIEFPDVDGRRIRTPEEFEGDSLGLSLTFLADPRTILKGYVSRSDSNNRPPAIAYNGEIRRFISYTSSAVHLSATRYENTGKIGVDSSFGEVTANTAKLEWHQRLGGAWILMGGYRFHNEIETPRADLSRQQLASDTYYSTLRWRFGEGNPLGNLSEAYLIASHYQDNISNRANSFGLGSKLVF